MNATPVTLGFREVLDTTDATTDAQDDQLHETCGAPATDASVWYVLEGTGTGVVVDVSSSDYFARCTPKARPRIDGCTLPAISASRGAVRMPLPLRSSATITVRAPAWLPAEMKPSLVTADRP